MKLLTALSKRISLIIGICGVICIAAMMIITTADVVARTAFGKAMTGIIEIMQIMFCVTLYSGLAYCQTRHSHIHVTLFITKLPGKSRYIGWGITSLVAAATGFMVTMASFIQAGVVIDRYSMLLWIPYYPFYIFGAVCMFIFTLCLLLDSAKSFTAAFKPELAEEISSSWVS